VRISRSLHTLLSPFYLNYVYKIMGSPLILILFIFMINRA